MKQVSNINRSAHNVFIDDPSTHNVLFDVLVAIYMECHKGAGGLFHKTCLGNTILSSKVVILIQTHMTLTCRLSARSNHVKRRHPYCSLSFKLVLTLWRPYKDENYPRH